MCVRIVIVEESGTSITFFFVAGSKYDDNDDNDNNDNNDNNVHLTITIEVRLLSRSSHTDL